MIALTGYNVLDYLLNRKLISFEDIYNGSWSFQEDSFLSARNTTLVAQTMDDRPAYFIKQPRSMQLPDDPLQLEYDVYRLISLTDAAYFVPNLISVPLTEELVQTIPYDVVNHVLLVEYVKQSESFLECLLGFSARAQADSRLEMSYRLGASLNQLHQSLSKPLIQDKAQALDRTIPDIENFQPWILQLTLRDLTSFKESNKLFVEKLGNLMTEKIFQDITDQIKEHWQDESTHLINTDARFANVIVASADRLLFVDWEQVGYGPRLWQLAGFVANYLSFLASENPPLSEAEVWKNIRQLFLGYFKDDSDTEQIKVTLRYAGLILLQDFYNWATADFPAGDSGNPDKFNLGRACLLYPEETWTGNIIIGLKEYTGILY